MQPHSWHGLIMDGGSILCYSMTHCWLWSMAYWEICYKKRLDMCLCDLAWPSCPSVITRTTLLLAESQVPFQYGIWSEIYRAWLILTCNLEPSPIKPQRAQKLGRNVNMRCCRTLWLYVYLLLKHIITIANRFSHILNIPERLPTSCFYQLSYIL